MPSIAFGLGWAIYQKVIRRKNIYIIKANRIGHLAAEMNLHYLSKAKFNQGVYVYNTPICNQKLFDMCTKNLNIISDKYLSHFIKVTEKLNVWDKIFNKLTICDDRDVQGLREFGTNSIKLNYDDRIRAREKIVSNIGADILCRKIAIINVRDETYLKSTLKDQSFDYHDFRNSDIYSYHKAIQFLIDEGFSVIRVGRITAKELNVSSKYFWDYSKSKIKSDLIDIFLAEEAYMCISTGSGYDALTSINKKPTLYVNYLPHGYVMAFSRQDYTCFKKLRDRLSGQFIQSVEEIYSKNVFSALDASEYQAQGVEIVDLNSAEILSCVQKFLVSIRDKHLNYANLNKDFEESFKQLLEVNTELRKVHKTDPSINIIEVDNV